MKPTGIQKTIDDFDKAARDWGWTSDQGYGPSVDKSESAYKSAKKKLQRDIDQIIERLQASVKSLEWAATVIGDMPPKCEYLESLAEAKALLARINP